MSAPDGSAPLTAHQVVRIVLRTLAPERSFVSLAAIYGIGIGLLSLATPIAVQVLINTVAYTGLTAPLVVLSLTLFALLLASGLLNALRVHLMEIFARRFYARMVARIALKALYARNPFFADEDRGPLFNRYFDIVAVQKAVPVLFIGGFTVILQVAVGFVLTSFYHPLFLAFNLVVTLLLWGVWIVWGRSAIMTSVAMSQRKHDAAAWVETLAASNGYYKSDRHVAFALAETDRATGAWVAAHRSHFRRFFAQTVSFLVIYAAASAALLGLGGWLVIQGQLTLGQLVAAELVLSAALYGISQLGTYFNYLYDLAAACEELSLIEAVEEEAPRGAECPPHDDATLVFDRVCGQARGVDACFDLTIPGGVAVLATASVHGVQRLFTNLLKRFDDPATGVLTLGGDDVSGMEAFALRRDVMVLDRPTVVGGTIRRYLALARDGVTSAEMLEALGTVGLGETVAGLEGGLDARIAGTGYPLSVSETMRLKLAGAVLARPAVLVLSPLYDTVPEGALVRSVRAAQECGGTGRRATVIVFTAAGRDLPLDGTLVLTPNEQVLTLGETGRLAPPAPALPYAAE